MNQNGGQRYVGQRHANRTRETFHVNAKRLLGAKNVCLAILGAAALAGETAAQDVGQVAALGRLEPRGGVVRVAAPSTPLSLAGSVVAELFVREGEDVVSGGAPWTLVPGNQKKFGRLRVLETLCRVLDLGG